MPPMPGPFSPGNPMYPALMGRGGGGAGSFDLGYPEFFILMFGGAIILGLALRLFFGDRK